MTVSVFTNFQGDIITGIRDADFAKEAFQVQSGADSFNCDDILLGHGAVHTSIQAHPGGDGFKKLDNITTGLGEAGVECKVPPSLLKPQEELDSRLINHDDFLLVNNLSGTAGPGGSTFLTGENGKAIVHPSFQPEADGYTEVEWTYLTENIGGTAGPGGSTFLTGYAEAVGLDSSTVDVVNQISNTERGY